MHTSKKVRKFLKPQAINWWKTPLESPNCSPIENVWHKSLEHIKRKQYHLLKLTQCLSIDSFSKAWESRRCPELPLLHYLRPANDYPEASLFDHSWRIQHAKRILLSLHFVVHCAVTKNFWFENSWNEILLRQFPDLWCALYATLHVQWNLH